MALASVVGDREAVNLTPGAPTHRQHAESADVVHVERPVRRGGQLLRKAEAGEQAGQRALDNRPCAAERLSRSSSMASGPEECDAPL